MQIFQNFKAISNWTPWTMLYPKNWERLSIWWFFEVQQKRTRLTKNSQRNLHLKNNSGKITVLQKGVKPVSGFIMQHTHKSIFLWKKAKYNGTHRWNVSGKMDGEQIFQRQVKSSSCEFHAYFEKLYKDFFVWSKTSFIIYI